MERRLQKLETLFGQLLPDIDIESSLESVDVSTSEPPIFDRVVALQTPPITTPLRQEEWSEALPDEADGFDWREQASEVDDLADGMAALSVEPEGVGYLGTALTSACINANGHRRYFWSCLSPIYPALDDWVF